MYIFCKVRIILNHFAIFAVKFYRFNIIRYDITCNNRQLVLLQQACGV